MQESTFSQQSLVYVSDNLYEWVPLPAYLLHKVSGEFEDVGPTLITPAKMLNSEPQTASHMIQDKDGQEDVDLN